MNSPDLMIFEPNRGGHHAEFTCHILWYWQRSVPEGRLLAALAPGLLSEQPGISAGAIHPPHTIEASLHGSLPGNLKGNWAKGRSNQRLLSEAIKRHRPKRVLVMYLDHAQLAFVMGLRFPFPVSISGILFHPTLHYGIGLSQGVRAYLQNVRKKLVLRLMARNPHLGTVFTLDSTAVSSLRRIGLDAMALPDPVIQDPTEMRTPGEMHSSHGIEPGRKVLLLFGALTARKGVVPLLQSICLLQRTTAQKVAVFMAGPLDPSLRSQVSRLESEATQAGAQVVIHDQLIQNGAVQSFMESADLVLAPYQRHFGSSAILIRAALAGRPVLSQDFGLMGENVRANRLGQSVDTRSPEAIAAGIERFMRDPSAGFDAETALDFARCNTPELFCETILSRLLPKRALEVGSTLQS